MHFSIQIHTTVVPMVPTLVLMLDAESLQITVLVNVYLLCGDSRTFVITFSTPLYASYYTCV